MMFTKRWDKSAIVKIGAVLGVSVALCLWLVMTINKMKAAQAEKLAQARGELSALQNDAGQLTTLQAEFKKMKAELSYLEPGVSDDRKATYLPTLLKQLQKLADDHNIKLEQLNPGEAKPPTNTPPPAAPSGPTGPAEPGAAPAAPAGPQGEQVPINLRMEGTFPQLMAFLEGLKTFPKVIEINSMQLQPRSNGKDGAGVSPKLGITMEASATVLPLVPGV